MIDPELAQRFEELTGVKLPEHLHPLFRQASADLDWCQIALALGDDGIADQLRIWQEAPNPRPIGEIVEKIMQRLPQGWRGRR